jgi:hypothetical protein
MTGNPSSPSGIIPTSFVVEMDLARLTADLGIDCGTLEDQEAVFAAEQEALAASPEPPAEVPGRVAALLPTGPGLAAWLASVSIGQCSDAELPDLALGYRRLAAWAQAQELSAVAEIASRTATLRNRADGAGRPDQVLPEAGAEVALALTMSQPTAMDWTGLATRLRWQLAATGAALTDGRIDLARARIIAEATAPLPDETARAVEERVLSAVEGQTTAQLRAAVRRAVIAGDPDGADRRRQQAERCAKVSLYPDHEGTATLVGSALPAVSAAAAMARITAIARAMKTAGFSGGLDYLRSSVMLGLLLGTPLPPGAPPDDPPPPDEPPSPDGPPDRPPPGLLDVLLPWSALTAGPYAEPARLGGIGPVTALQTRQLLELATRHPATEWRILITDENGHARAVERLRCTSCSPPFRTRAGPTTAPVIGRITVTIPRAALTSPGPPARSKLAAALLRAAERAIARAQAAGRAGNNCAHQHATAAYRPTPRLRDFVVARDGTCTFPPCGQPAWRADLDHTIPWHHGGPTCACNLGARCRTHHKIKQLPGWKLEQPQPGMFRWTTPAGRSYTCQPNRYPI